MVNIKRILLLFMLTSGLGNLYAQDSIKVCLHDVQCAIERPSRISIRKPMQDSVVQPADTNIYLHASYRIKAIDQIDKVKIKAGLSQNSSECLEAEVAVTSSGGKHYVHFSGQLYEIFYQHGFYRSVISKAQMEKANWLSIYATDKKGQKTQTYYYKIK